MPSLLLALLGPRIPFLVPLLLVVPFPVEALAVASAEGGTEAAELLQHRKQQWSIFGGGRHAAKEKLEDGKQSSSARDSSSKPKWTWLHRRGRQEKLAGLLEGQLAAGDTIEVEGPSTRPEAASDALPPLRLATSAAADGIDVEAVGLAELRRQLEAPARAEIEVEETADSDAVASAGAEIQVEETSDSDAVASTGTEGVKDDGLSAALFAGARAAAEQERTQKEAAASAGMQPNPRPAVAAPAKAALSGAPPQQQWFLAGQRVVSATNEVSTWKTENLGPTLAPLDVPMVFPYPTVAPIVVPLFLASARASLMTTAPPPEAKLPKVVRNASGLRPKDGYLVVVMIHTTPDRFEWRKMLRLTLGELAGPAAVNGRPVRLVIKFATGTMKESMQSRIKEKMEQELKDHGDSMAILDMEDGSIFSKKHEEVGKTWHVLKYAADNFPDADLVFSVNDDTIVDWRKALPRFVEPVMESRGTAGSAGAPDRLEQLYVGRECAWKDCGHQELGHCAAQELFGLSGEVVQWIADNRGPAKGAQDIAACEWVRAFEASAGLKQNVSGAGLLMPSGTDDPWVHPLKDVKTYWECYKAAHVGSGCTPMGQYKQNLQLPGPLPREAEGEMSFLRSGSLVAATGSELPYEGIF